MPVDTSTRNLFLDKCAKALEKIKAGDLPDRIPEDRVSLIDNPTWNELKPKDYCRVCDETIPYGEPWRSLSDPSMARDPSFPYLVMHEICYHAWTSAVLQFQGESDKPPQP